MYRDGNFQNLRWNMLEASHKAHWEKLSSVYGLEEPEKLLKSEAQKKDMPVLDQLAELCICSCQNYLFSLTPVKDVSNVFNDVLTAPDDLPMRIRRDMPHHFELALRDHLIVTFAYRFCCDNLEPRSFDDYVNTLFDYIAEFDKTANPIDLAEIRKNYRRDFRKDFRNKYRNFCEQFTLTTSESGGECSNNPQAGPADKPSENTTCKGKEKQATVLDAFTNLHWRDIKEPLDLSSKISKKLDMNSIAPPDAWFLLFCASRKVKYISALRSSSENYDKISNLFRPISEQRGSLDIHKYDIVSALFPVEDCDQAFNTMPKEARSSCIWIYPVIKSNVSFAGIPIDKKDCLASPLPDQEYYLKDYTDNESETVSRKITISADMQLVFNAYLLERNFHIFTIACAERIHQLRLNSDTYFPEWTACLLSPLRLRAPLLHAEFLNYLIDRPAVMERRSILNCYFAQWNRIGLPILEEYFLHLVKVYFNNIMFGSLTGMAATLLFGFLAFGTFLQCVGADKYFMDICISVAGRRRGGPAKVAVISSAAMGTISGSSIANVVTTGTLTIPMMKKTGYTAEEAGAIETCASTGGQIMPPIMGTGAFILAETVGVPYSDVCFVSIIPAILFYIAIYFLVDLIARKRNLHGLPASDIRPLKQTMHAGGVFFIPILILVVLLVLGYTPFLSGVGCALLILLIGQIRKDTRVSAKKIVFALEDCAKSLTSIGGVIFCASLIVSMINITGLMMKTSAIILSFSQGKLWLTLLLVALIAYILGMGLPISTSYIILATLSAPAIVSLGVDMLVVHLTIFWFTQLATITPPVCMTAFAAAGIAQGQPMKTGFTALKMGFTFYYVPVLFVYSQLINGAWWVQCIIAVFAIIAIYFLGTFTEKYFMGDLGNIQRFTGLAIFAVIYFMMFDGLTMPMRGALLALAVALIASLYIVQKKKQQAAA